MIPGVGINLVITGLVFGVKPWVVGHQIINSIRRISI